eukprot:6376617-Amphidinium_carterae.1
MGAAVTTTMRTVAATTLPIREGVVCVLVPPSFSDSMDGEVLVDLMWLAMSFFRGVNAQSLDAASVQLQPDILDSTYKPRSFSVIAFDAIRISTIRVVTQ